MSPFMQPVEINRADTWDALLRLSHWILLGLLILAFLTTEGRHSLHVLVGYAVAGLFAIRVVWALLGQRPVRLSELVRHVIAQAHRGLISSQGIAPAPILTVFGLIASMFAVSTASMILLTHVFWGTTSVELMHAVFVYFTVFLVVLQGAGVLFAMAHYVFDTPRDRLIWDVNHQA